MSWRVDPKATRAAAELFGARQTVKRNGRQYLLERTPYGQMELIPIGRDRYLVAVESPPADAPRYPRSALTPELAEHLRSNGLHPWRIVPGAEASEALGNLARAEPAGQDDATGPAWSRYTCDLPKGAKLVGADRLRLAERWAGLIAAPAAAGALPAMAGPRGVGKRTLTAEAAGRLGLSAVELPLHRILTDRILQTPMELFVETALAAISQLSERDLLVVSDAEAIALTPPRQRREILAELGRVPHVVLLADVGDLSAAQLPGVVPQACPGLAGTEEAGELIATNLPGIELATPALVMLCRAASLHGVGVVPGRLLYTIGLARSLIDPTDPSKLKRISPDEAAPAIELAARAWQAPATAGWDRPQP